MNGKNVQAGKQAWSVLFHECIFLACMAAWTFKMQAQVSGCVICELGLSTPQLDTVVDRVPGTLV